MNLKNEGCPFVWLPSGRGKPRKKHTQEADEVLSNKIGKFPPSNYTLTTQMGTYCTISLNKGLLPLMHKEPL